MLSETSVAESVQAKEEAKVPSGVLYAALVSVAVGLLAFAVVNIASEANAGAKDAVFAIGKAWIPNAAGMGPYSGKLTAMLAFWLGSWTLLHFAWRRREMSDVLWSAVFIIGVAAAAVLMWPPVYEPIVHALKG
jgi:hypothetical protein